MDISNGGERLAFAPTQTPNSPPSTPGSSKMSYAQVAASGLNDTLHRFFGPDFSPPENLAPVSGHKFSYAPQLRGDSSSGSDDTGSVSDATLDIDIDDAEIDDADIPVIDIPMFVPDAPIIAAATKRQVLINICSFDDDCVDFIIEEVSEDDIGYDSHEVILPVQCDDVDSDEEEEAEEEVITTTTTNFTLSDSSDSDSDSDENEEIINGISDLPADLAREELRQQREEFEEAQRQKYIRKKKRWSKGGNHKRSIAESIGSSSDKEDIVPLDDADLIGSSARRLRRRTEGPEMRPRPSLLFADPPREAEELRYLAEQRELAETEDMMVPAWMYPVVIESDSESEDDGDDDADEEEDDDSDDSDDSDDDGEL